MTIGVMKNHLVDELIAAAMDELVDGVSDEESIYELEVVFFRILRDYDERVQEYIQKNRARQGAE